MNPSLLLAYVTTAGAPFLDRLTHALAEQRALDAAWAPEGRVPRVLITDAAPENLPAPVREAFAERIVRVASTVRDPRGGKTHFCRARARNAAIDFARAQGHEWLMLCDCDAVLIDQPRILPASGYGVPKIYGQKSADEDFSLSLSRALNPDAETFSVGNSWFILGREIIERFRFNENFHGHGWEDREFDARVKAAGIPLEECDLRMVQLFHPATVRAVDEDVERRDRLLFEAAELLLAHGRRPEEICAIEIVEAEHPEWSSPLILLPAEGRVIHKARMSQGGYLRHGGRLRIAWDNAPAEDFILAGGVHRLQRGTLAEAIGAIGNFAASLDEFIRSMTALGQMSAAADQATVAARLNEILARYLARSNAHAAFSFDFADLIGDLRVDHGELCLMTIAAGEVRISLHNDWRGIYPLGEIARRCASVIFLLDHVLRRNPAIHGAFLCELGDRGNFPSVGFSAFMPGSCLIPDTDFFESFGYEATRQRLREEFVPWEQRRGKIFWRGSSTGPRQFDPPPEDAADDFTWLQRLALCARSQSALRPEIFDVGINRIVQIDEPHLIARIERAGLLRPFASRDEFMCHKGVIVVDGNYNAWSAAFCGLLTGSCILLVGSPQRYRQWYYDALKPWEHYVPVAADLRDLEEAAAWVLAHDDRARAIGAAGRHFALAQSFDAAIEDAITRLAAWIPNNPFARLSRQRDES